MKLPTPDSRQIIWESKTKQVGLVAMSFAFVAGAIWTYDKLPPIAFWGGVLVFGGGGLCQLYMLLSGKYMFVSSTSALAKRIRAEQLEGLKADFGGFAYDADGFTFNCKREDAEHHKWAELKTVFAYKLDQYVTDELCLDLFFPTCGLTLTESTRGWYQFLTKLHENVPAIPPDWQARVLFPAFATNLTLLYDKAGRTQAEAEAVHYKEQEKP